MTKSRADIARAKMKMLDLYTLDPLIPDTEMAKRCNLDTHTVAKYKKDLMAKILSIKASVEQQLVEKVEQKVSIWQKLNNLMK